MSRFMQRIGQSPDSYTHCNNEEMCRARPPTLSYSTNIEGYASHSCAGTPYGVSLNAQLTSLRTSQAYKHVLCQNSTHTWMVCWYPCDQQMASVHITRLILKIQLQSIRFCTSHQLGEIRNSKIMKSRVKTRF